MRTNWLTSAVFFFSAATLSASATLTVTPPVSYSCVSGLATVTLNWSGATGPVQINVGKANGTALTGTLGASGSAMTGNWVYDGLTFYLVDQSGAVQASAVAHVSCGGASYFPLTVGNTWVYKYNDRGVTNGYLVRSITGTQTAGTMTYYVLTQTVPAPSVTVMLLRADDNGVIWQSTSTGDQIYFDPNAKGDQQTTYSGALGTFTNALMPPAQIMGGLSQVFSTFVPGLGLVNSQSNLLSGSSGGFASSLDLIDAQVDGLHISVPAPTLSLSAQSTDLDLTNKLAPNCAIPCYFVACNIAGADPTGFYRPCTQIRVDSSAAPATAAISVQLIDPSGTTVFTAQGVNGTDYIRLPLYTNNTASTLVVIPPGDYKLQATMPNSSSTITLHIH